LLKRLYDFTIHGRTHENTLFWPQHFGEPVDARGHRARLGLQGLLRPKELRSEAQTRIHFSELTVHDRDASQDLVARVRILGGRCSLLPETFREKGRGFEPNSDVVDVHSLVALFLCAEVVRWLR
jgi:hypothetical protein